MNDIENPEIGDEHVPIVEDVNPSPEHSDELKSITASESVELDLCLATFHVETVSSIGKEEHSKWIARLGIGSIGGPDIKNS